jgi:hypothetical protein
VVFWLIIVSGFVGVGGLAAAKWLSNHGAGKWGMQVLIGAIIAGVLFGVIYGFLVRITG